MTLTTGQYNDLYQRIKSGLGWYVEFMMLCREYYINEPCGGNLHIVLDDGNIGITYVAYCQGLADARKDMQGSQIAHLMEAMTKRQRKLVVKNHKVYAGSDTHIADITCGEVYK